MEMGLIALGQVWRSGWPLWRPAWPRHGSGRRWWAPSSKTGIARTMIILLVIPETLVIFGFTIAILILTTLK